MDVLQKMDGPPRILQRGIRRQSVFYPLYSTRKERCPIGNRWIVSHPTDPRFQFVQTTPAKEALIETLPKIPKDVDMIVALGSMDDEEVERLQQTFLSYNSSPPKGQHSKIPYISQTALKSLSTKARSIYSQHTHSTYDITLGS